MRILGIDFGDKNIGLALSDPLQITALPLELYHPRNPEEDKKFFQQLIKMHNIGLIVLGLPIRMDGSLGTRAQKTKEFASWLKNHFHIPVVFWDERLTSKEASRLLAGRKIDHKFKKKIEHQISATIILSSFLESKKNNAYSKKNR